MQTKSLDARMIEHNEDKVGLFELTEERLRIVIEASPCGMVMVDERGIIVLVNSQLERLFGYDRQELLGQSIEILVPLATRNNHSDYLAEFFADPIASRPMGSGRDLYGQCKDGTQLAVEIALNPLTAEDHRFVLASVVDITQRKQLEEKTKKLAVMERHEEFMATLTHDLKNPLIGANRILELMAQQMIGTVSPEQSRLLLQLRNNNMHLLSMIQNLIEVYRFEKDVDTITMENTNLLKIIPSCVDNIQPIARNREIKINAELPVVIKEVWADASSIRRVLQNLLDNALKFTPDGGQIKIAVSGNNGSVIIEIGDTGPGIPDDEQHRLFQRFSQGRIGKKYTPGTGLGLYLCKQIIDNHKGELKCFSKEGEGTTFTIVLPAA